MITTSAQRDRGPPKVLTAPTLPCEVSRRGAAAFEIVLTEGRNRQIRRMCEAIGFKVTKLQREAVMGIGLDGLASSGEWAELDADEMASVRAAIAEAELAEPEAAGAAPHAGAREVPLEVIGRRARRGAKTPGLASDPGGRGQRRRAREARGRGQRGRGTGGRGALSWERRRPESRFE